jgi:hypothetical protein
MTFVLVRKDSPVQVPIGRKGARNERVQFPFFQMSSFRVSSDGPADLSRAWNSRTHDAPCKQARLREMPRHFQGEL